MFWDLQLSCCVRDLHNIQGLLRSRGVQSKTEALTTLSELVSSENNLSLNFSLFQGLK